MRLGIMQPYFFPYIGYFSLIAATDQWVVFDTPQYIRKGWVNRNRVLKKNEGWKYIGIPIKKASRDTAIKDIEINEPSECKDLIFRNLDYYKDRKAPFYSEIVDLLELAFSDTSSKLCPLLVNCLKMVCDYVKMDFNYSILSEMNLSIGEVSHAGEWALRIAEALNAKTYINPPGGREIFDPIQFQQLGIDLLFLQPTFEPYDQKHQEFISGLSIIDVLMWNSSEKVLKMIHQYTLVD